MPETIRYPALVSRSDDPWHHQHSGGDMDGNRFDALTTAWGRMRGTDGTSRRGVLSLLTALVVGGKGALHPALAQEVGVERISCHGRCAQGQVCKHGACLDRCGTPG